MTPYCPDLPGTDHYGDKNGKLSIRKIMKIMKYGYCIHKSKCMHTAKSIRSGFCFDFISHMNMKSFSFFFLLIFTLREDQQYKECLQKYVYLVMYHFQSTV